MSAWGTDIFEDDLTCDIQDEFNEMLDEGLSAAEATGHILEDFLEELDEFEDEDEKLAEEALVYIALAQLQLRHQSLQEAIRTKTIELINKGADLPFWEEAGQKDYLERKQVLEELKQKLMNTEIVG
ncbi:MarR family transcriptional regulator [Priestia abyssalis]|uniref:MarR family transcriptional regulator n=1 Tax=Priestia abyssalis TaxID=1221450 RepID=UPI0009953AB0|nr:MarR family transcriptional regulator [Priestia abyssalis]